MPLLTMTIPDRELNRYPASLRHAARAVCEPLRPAAASSAMSAMSAISDSGTGPPDRR